MKKIFALMCAASVLFAACTLDDAAKLPAVSFESAVPVVADGVATFKIATANYSGTEPVTIPVTITTEAEQGTDFTVSAEAFVVGGSSPVTEIVVSTLNFGTGKTLTMTLGIPDGWSAGQYTTSTFSLTDKLGWVSFVNKKGGMTDKSTITVGLYDAQGNSLRLNNEDKITVSVKTSESTAIEGTHFSFAGEKSVTIPAGESKGTLVLNMIGDTVIEGADKLVLELDPGSKYELGANHKTTITILGSEWNRLAGEWKIEKMLVDAETIRSVWDYENVLTGYEFIPSYDADGDGVIDTNADDKIVFDMDALTLTPDFKSTFKNYFIGVSSITPAGDYPITVGGKNSEANWNPDGYNKGYVSTPMIELDNTNRYFSPTAQSEEKESYLAYGMKKDADNNDVLILYFIDVTPKESFLPQWTEHMFNTSPDFVDKYSWIYNTSRPFITGNYPSFLIASFKRAK